VNVGAQLSYMPDTIPRDPDPDTAHVVGIPQPVAAIGKVERRDAEVEAPNQKRLGPHGKTPHMLGTEARGEVAVFPRMIKW